MKIKHIISYLLVFSFLNINLKVLCFAQDCKNDTLNNSRAAGCETSQKYKVCGLFSKSNTSALYIVSLDKKYGIADKEGNIIIPCSYDSLKRFYPVIIAEKDKKFGAFSYSGDTVLPAEYDSIICKYHSLIVKNNNKFALFSAEGKSILDFEYDNINHFMKDKFLITKDSKKFCFDLESKKITELPFDRIIISGNNFIVEKDGKKGVYKYEAEKLIIPIKYDDLKSLGGKYLVTLGQNQGLYSLSGEEILKPIYKKINYKQYNYWILQKDNDKYDIVYSSKNLNKEIISEADEILSKKCIKSGEGTYIPVKKYGKYGLILNYDKNADIKTILPFEYDGFGNYINCYSKKKGLQRFICIFKEDKAALFNLNTLAFDTDFLYENYEKLGNTSYLKVKTGDKYILYDMLNKKFGKSKYEDIRTGKFITEYYGQNIQVKKNGIWYYKNPVSIIAQGTSYGILYAGAIVSMPVTIPAAAVLMGLIYWSCYTPAAKIPADLPEKINAKNP